MDFKDIKKGENVQFQTGNEWNKLYGIIHEICGDIAYIFSVHFPNDMYKIIKGYNENDIKLAKF